jgi:ParB family chromosome partitioning protein
MLNASITSQSIPIGKLQESPTNPRRTFSEEALQEIVDSIRALGGLVQPIIVRPLEIDAYQVVAGARRFRAAKVAGLDAIDARVMELFNSSRTRSAPTFILMRPRRTSPC